MEQPSIDMTPFDDFESASRAVLHFLHTRIDMGLWMMTRTEGDDWIVLQADDRGYGIDDGAVFEWSDTYCSRMVRDDGPRVAPNAGEIPAYVEAAINQNVGIGAYVGVPVRRNDGGLFGTLCAIDPGPKDDAIRSELPTIELLARLLGTVLSSELEAIENERSRERSQREAETDHTTGLANRRGWDAAIAMEEARAARYGNPTGVVIVDLDDLKSVNDTSGHAEGDILIGRAARALDSAVRRNDVVARVGGDEFGVIAVECDTNDLERLVGRVCSALFDSGVAASIGRSTRNPGFGLLEAVSDADRDMYSDKSARRTRA